MSNIQMDKISDYKIKIGVIGLGRMGLMHSALFNSLPDSKLVAVMDPAKFPSKQLGELNPAIKVFNDIDKMFEEVELDAVLIASPVSSHVQNALKCIEKGIPFLIEKPLSINSDQAIPLMEKLKEKPVPNMVGYMYRFLDSFRKGKEILDTNCLGNIQRVDAKIHVSQLFQKGKGWRYDPQKSGGGCLINNGSHLIDILTWYFGPISSVNGNVLSYYSSGIEDFAHLIIKHKRGVTTIFDCSWSVRFKRKIDMNIDILGDNGSLIVSDDAIQLFLDKAVGKWPVGKTSLNANDLFSPVPVDIGTPKFTIQNQYFLKSLISGEKLQPDVRQAYHVQKVIDAGYKSSLENGSPVLISDLESLFKITKG
jgi:predicted dehydrogenase